MAVSSVTKGMQLILLFEDGLGTDGKKKIRRKVYRGVNQTASQQDIYETAAALAGLQEHPLVGVEQAVQTQLFQV